MSYFLSASVLDEQLQIYLWFSREKNNEFQMAYPRKKYSSISKYIFFLLMKLASHFFSPKLVNGCICAKDSGNESETDP